MPALLSKTNSCGYLTKNVKRIFKKKIGAGLYTG
jgi:hypothetical protein